MKKAILLLPIPPVTLACPLCNAKPGDDCKTASGINIEVVRVARIKAPKDAGTKKRRVS